jgi:DNA-binding transcriptional LysR family regulator
MRGPGTPTIDQMQVLVAIADEGGLAAAARRLKRATSAISYAIDNLEAQLGMALFERVTTRRPHLTKGGEAVLADARAVLAQLDRLKARVRGLSEGLEAEVALAVDVMLPHERLTGALAAFRGEFPTVALRLHAEALGGVVQRVRSGEAVLGITNTETLDARDLEQVGAGSVRLIPVAASGHPLARKNGRERPQDHVQLVLSDPTSLTEGRDFGVLAAQSWRLADLSTKHALLLAGLGWGNMPEFLVRADLKARRLVALKPDGVSGMDYRFRAVWRRDAPPGPAARWLASRFIAQS